MNERWLEPAEPVGLKNWNAGGSRRQVRYEQGLWRISLLVRSQAILSRSKKCWLLFAGMMIVALAGPALPWPWVGLSAYAVSLACIVIAILSWNESACLRERAYSLED